MSWSNGLKNMFKNKGRKVGTSLNEGSKVINVWLLKECSECMTHVLPKLVTELA